MIVICHIFKMYVDIYIGTYLNITINIVLVYPKQ